jgi:D-sedoheptulose 7-phosphate isomerase
MVVAFSTSGRSDNVVRGLAAARERRAVTVLFGGGDGGPAAEHADHRLVVPSSDTARIQEMHVLMLHLIIDRVDEWAASTDPLRGRNAPAGRTQGSASWRGGKT